MSKYSSKCDSEGACSHEEQGVQADDVKAPLSLDAVVKVFCAHTKFNLSLPWTRKKQYNSKNSGLIISGRRVLTTASSVEGHTHIMLQRHGSNLRCKATVLAIGIECDIAILTVDTSEFWEGVKPIEFGDLPRLNDAVKVVGFPIGGETITVTSGVVSRIDVTLYVHGDSKLLGVQIDAAISAGSFGSPTFNDRGECVGIAFHFLKHKNAQSICYIIPTPVIKHFIEDIRRNSEYTGFPVLGVDCQKMENPDLRKALGMEENQKGVLIQRVDPTAPAAANLQFSDIILSLDGIDIGNDGTVPWDHGDCLPFSHLVSQKFTGENVRIKILRMGKPEDHVIQLATDKRLVPFHIEGKPPSYYIIAGIVFIAVSFQYRRSKYPNTENEHERVPTDNNPIECYPNAENEQLVVISEILAANINIGYGDIKHTQVLAFNGTPIYNLKHLATLVDSCAKEFLKFKLQHQRMLVLQTAAAKMSTHDILETYCIPSACSSDLKN
ncbi:hypothetical protein O6H91_23G004800 [Diphasiastrum complanatum]|uniref:Uncharacterized protein n=1 Tax=Diphasiastrum complanatum TaxID=34168 RepID=A0ACC2A7P1_DIPCM|nr:hypothetical protein O6H91_23G004800 [Diphasiastrum complanatum]